jgi:hypothetical protein
VIFREALGVALIWHINSERKILYATCITDLKVLFSSWENLSFQRFELL